MITPDQRAALAAPFPNVQWRVAKKLKSNEKRGEVVCYIDARDVMQRLDEVFGDDGWSFDWTPITMGKDADGEFLRTAKGTLSIGGISRSDIGEAGNYEKSKAAVSDALKRAAVHFGIARYLYDMEAQYADLDQYGNITPDARKVLDGKLAALVRRTFGDMPQQSGLDEADVLRSVLLAVMPDKSALIDQMDVATLREKIASGLKKGIAAAKQNAA